MRVHSAGETGSSDSEDRFLEEGRAMDAEAGQEENPHRLEPPAEQAHRVGSPRERRLPQAAQSSELS